MKLAFAPALAVVPTQRAAVLAGLAAPLALVLAAAVPGAWLAAPALGLALVALVVADALLAGRLADLRGIAPADAGGGGPVPPAGLGAGPAYSVA